jgi:glycerol-3-phosphate dehydrogenase
MAEETVTQVAKHLGMHGAAHCQTAHVPLLESAQPGDPSGILPPPVTEQNVQHFCRSEWARHLDDVMIRRTSWHYYHRDRREIAQRVAEWMADELGWDEPQHSSEFSRYEKALHDVTEETERGL